jgi:fatty-acyl-CoA synthase
MERSLLQRLAQHADRRGDRPAIFFRAGNDWETWTWAEYWDRARRAARGLRASGVGPGDRVLVLSSDVKSAVTAQLGLWTIGAIPAQLGLPDRLTNLDGFLDELHHTLRQLETNTLLVDRSLTAMVAPRDDRRVLVVEDLMEGPAGDATDSQSVGGALLQLTSGSTGHPRAVLVPHDRLVRHLESISQRLPSSASSVGVSWLPLYHDMGLIGGLLYPCFNGFPVYLLSPLEFRRNPYFWLQTMSRVRATHTAAPPSGYAVCLRLAARALEDQLDLSSLGCAMIGAEPRSAVRGGLRAVQFPTRSLLSSVRARRGHCRRDVSRAAGADAGRCNRSGPIRARGQCENRGRRPAATRIRRRRFSSPGR